MPRSPPFPLIAAWFARTAGRVKGRGNAIAKRRRKAPLRWSAGSPIIRRPGAGRPGRAWRGLGAVCLPGVRVAAGDQEAG